MICSKKLNWTSKTGRCVRLRRRSSRGFALASTGLHARETHEFEWFGLLSNWLWFGQDRVRVRSKKSIKEHCPHLFIMHGLVWTVAVCSCLELYLHLSSVEYVPLKQYHMGSEQWLPNSPQAVVGPGGHKLVSKPTTLYSEKQLRTPSAQCSSPHDQLGIPAAQHGSVYHRPWCTMTSSACQQHIGVLTVY